MQTPSLFLIRTGTAEEIGCCDGTSTARMAEHCDDLSVLDASAEQTETASWNT